MDFEAPELANTALGATFRVTNGVPVIVERAMWWPGEAGTWQEGHNSFGATETGEKWGLAEGEVGGANSTETYILLANTSGTAGLVRVTLTFEDGSPQVTRDINVAANSRANVAVAFDFPEAVGKRFGAVVESIGARQCSWSWSVPCTAIPAASYGQRARVRSGRSCAEGTVPWSRYAARARSLVALGIRLGDTDRG